MQTLFGASPIEGGYIECHGKKISGDIKHFMKNKIAMLPSNRKENSVIHDLTIIENMYSAEHQISGTHQLINIKNRKIL